MPALGVAEDRICVDHGLTGRNRARPGLDQALAAVREGDTLVVARLDRLARSAPDAQDIADRLSARGVKLALGGAVYDPTDPMERMFFNIPPPSPSSKATSSAWAPARTWPSPAPGASSPTAR
ncbi:recombinase family protein [Rhodovulum sp. DZ06]|uniref:recombinase family protein n=1 Tax=Rhodovulum sp. DZ06 TaxID=3425126 RepID=UPI003D324EDF